eukprot:11957425-Ditylum_brightwellii.AAC.1
MESYQTKEVVLTAEYYQAQEIIQTIIEMEIDDPIAFATKHDPDTMALAAYTNTRCAQGNQNLGCYVGHEVEKGHQDKSR